MYLRQSLLKKFGQEAADAILSTDEGWDDVIASFIQDFFD
jgi:hypothetical protein